MKKPIEWRTSWLTARTLGAARQRHCHVLHRTSQLQRTCATAACMTGSAEKSVMTCMIRAGRRCFPPVSNWRQFFGS